MRGEPERVAERVRNLLDEHGRLPRDEGSEPAPRGVPTADGRSRAGGSRVWSRLTARIPMRVDPGRRGALAVGVAVALAAALTGAWVLAARPSAVPVSSSPPTDAATASARASSASGGAPASGPPPASSSAPFSPAALVVVDVAGKVRHPGLYRLPPGSRVDDAVRAAGGALRGVRLDSLNLAAKLVDGQQIAVGVPPAPGAGGVGSGGGTGGGSGGGTGGGTGGGAGGAPASGPVNLNTASPDELQTLPGVGPVLAQHIVDWRSAHGGFRSIEQLDDVTGIGDVKFAALKPLVSV